jgi:DNA-binding NarL/FixJ family response regulator
LAELRVLVVAGDPLARSGLASLLSQAGCAVVGQVSGDSDLTVYLTLYQPDVTLWDLGWDPSIELETNLELLADLADSGLPVVALLPAATHVGEVWATGASGVLRRGADPKSLLAALQAAVQGLLIVDPELAADVIPSQDPTHEALIEELTPREIEVPQLLADGLTKRPSVSDWPSAIIPSSSTSPPSDRGYRRCRVPTGSGSP